MEEITEFQLITALQEAFTCYLAYLSHTQKSRESKLPRQGKDIETTSDLSTQHNFLSRVAATETCLQYTRKIARNVKRWNSNPVDQAREESITGGVPEVVSLEALVKDLEERHKPFLDTFSGSWINPITSYSAGPSGSSDKAPATNSPIRESLKVIDTMLTLTLNIS
jgi:hypothetical protein